MVENNYKEVDFKNYCYICRYKNKKGHEDPCNECLDNPVNLNSKKPINFIEKESK